MGKKHPFWLCFLGLFSVLPVVADADMTPVSASHCDRSLATRIPARSAFAATGSEVEHRLESIGDDAREAVILEQIASGNIPEFQRHLVPVTMAGKTADGDDASVTLCVIPDYLAVGSDDDFFLVPMRLRTALSIATQFGFMLPTAKIVDAIYRQAQVQLHPQPLPAGDQMRSTAYYWHHAALVRDQRLSFGFAPGALTAGDKKDLVITNRLWQYPDRVAIYGWHLGVGHPIQPLSTVHGSRYADYSHGVRLIASTVAIDGRREPLSGLLEDKRRAGLVSDEGVMPRLPELLARLGGALGGADVGPSADSSSGKSY